MKETTTINWVILAYAVAVLCTIGVLILLLLSD